MQRSIITFLFRWVIILAVAIGLGTGIFLWRYQSVTQETELPVALPFVETQEESPLGEPAPRDEPKEESVTEEFQEEVVAEEPTPETGTQELPSSINLAVPFTSQAPEANWDLPYQEACEEASMLMVDWYYKGVESVSVKEADQAILDFVAFEESQGLPVDLTAQEAAQVIRDYFGYTRVEVLEDPTVEILKTHLAAGRPVIVPAAGRLLGNPHFQSPGPLYHMLVLRGYMDGQFITNDPGTRYGEAYLYPFDTVLNAMHDWNGGQVETGAKRAIVIYP